MQTLKRRFAPWEILLISVNGTIGSAWLFAPLYAAKIAGVAALLAWVLGGGITLLIAFTFVEIVSRVPVAGGTVRLACMTQGLFCGYWVSWVAWLSSVTMPAIEIQAVLQYASTYMPGLTHPEGGVEVLTGMGFLWAVVLMAVLSFINIYSFKGFRGSNWVVFGIKVGVILLVMGVLLTTAFHPAHFSIPVSRDAWGNPSSFSWMLVLSAVASGGVAFAFTGFKHGVEMAGEVKDPHRSILVGIAGSVIVCLLLYLGLQVAFIGALPDGALAEGFGALSFAHDAGPFAGLLLGLGAIWILRCLLVDAALSPLGAGLIYTTSTARMVYAMGEVGFMPRLLAAVNREGFPWIAVLLNALVGLFLFLPLPGWQAMVNFLVSAMVLSYGMGPVALLCLRAEVGPAAQGFRVPCAKLFAFLAFYCCNLINYWTGWDTLRRLHVALLFGLIVWLGLAWRGRLAGQPWDMRAAGWLLPYIAWLWGVAYAGSFGGQQWIPFGWDLAIIALLSALTLWSAVKLRVRGMKEVNMIDQWRGTELL